jgi:hypothetical protein
MPRIRDLPLLTSKEDAALRRVRARRARTMNVRLHRPRRALSPQTMARIARGVAKFITPTGTHPLIRLVH